MPVSQQDVADLRAAVEGNPGGWYHTFEFPGGVVTEGFFDHRRLLYKFPFPASLAGKRCLDLASSDGLFAFEMARRGGRYGVSILMTRLSRTGRQAAAR